MNLRARVVICSADPALVRRLQAFGAGLAEVRAVDSLRELERLAQGVDGLLLLLDLQTPDYANAIAFAVGHTMDGVCIAVAVPDSEPSRLAQASGLYAVVSPEAERQDIQLLLTRAIEHINLKQELALLKAGLGAAVPVPPPPPAPPVAEEARTLRTFELALRNFDRVETLYQQIVEGVAGVARVSRVGLFSQAAEDAPFTLQAGVRCLERARALSYPANHPLCLWLHAHAHLISRFTLDHVPAAEDRLMLRQSMDLLGAEVLIPIHTHQHFGGWLLFGHHVTGRPFTHPELEELMSLTNHVAVIIENARLYTEVSLRKSLAETLFDNLPTGIVATTETGSILWLNRSAAQIFDVDPVQHLDQPVDRLSSKLADCIRRTLGGREVREPEIWRLVPGPRLLSVQTRRLTGAHARIGAVALVQDVTEQRLMHERQEHLARCTFWNQLAASMSHEVRNPLVAIKAFAQLLPERYDDPEFRVEFSTTVSHEVDRLDAIIKQMNDFANLPRPRLESIDIRDAIQRAQDEARLRAPASHCAITVTTAGPLPPILGDSRALADCFTHLFINAIEAMQGQPHPQIQVRLTPISATDGRPAGLHTAVTDNGGGIPRDMLPAVFSPFSTTKNRGMGLGLAIVQRLVLDHGGQIDVTSTEKGTTVNILLPVAAGTAEARL
ncbi:MAG: PAS domain-containing protein [Lentisphaerae bacterium]|nr:PAS domain-containing protein [Lentisphaerota bacterium]